MAWQERAATAKGGKEKDEHPLVDLLPTESEVEETIMTAATNVEGIATDAGQPERCERSLQQHAQCEERSEA